MESHTMCRDGSCGHFTDAEGNLIPNPGPKGPEAVPLPLQGLLGDEETAMDLARTKEGAMSQADLESFKSQHAGLTPVEVAELSHEFVNFMLKEAARYAADKVLARPQGQPLPNVFKFVEGLMKEFQTRLETRGEKDIFDPIFMNPSGPKESMAEARRIAREMADVVLASMTPPAGPTH